MIKVGALMASALATLAAATPSPAAIFADVGDGHPFRGYVERIYELGVTSGCGVDPLRYCPDALVTRGQMAVFVLRGREGGGYVPPPGVGVFADVPVGHMFGRWVEEVYRRGVTSGCRVDPLRYCPDAPVTRGQMAVFVLRGRYGAGYQPPAATGGVFADVPVGHPFAAWIEQLAREGITRGCAPNLFCPDAPVTRGQMAVFLTKSFNLLSEGCRFSQLLRINAPSFGISAVRFSETAIAWFGLLSPDSNWAQIRAGYNAQGLYVYVGVFDRHLWYDENPTSETLHQWDAVTLLLDTSGSGLAGPTRWRFTAQLYGEPSPPRRAVWTAGPSGWQPASVPFEAEPGWRGGALNDNGETDRGWAMGFTIPWSSLGLAGAPASGTEWRLAVVVHDRDTFAGPALPDQAWPPLAGLETVDCWGVLRFGLPSWSSSHPVAGTVVIRRPSEGSSLVPDADVGGSAANQCPGDEFHIWNQWANLNWGTSPSVNIQNQSDIADWPCFSRYYVTFPLTDVPPGKRIVFATLVLHQFGNAGGDAAQPSWIQVLVAERDWDEATIPWNNAPLARENVGGAWVAPLDVFPGWPGVARTWDVSYAVAQAYARGEPARLVLYSADSAYHSGKYFVSSDTGDWNLEGRPTLVVGWAEP